jgi:hypothetical protein
VIQDQPPAEVVLGQEHPAVNTWNWSADGGRRWPVEEVRAVVVGVVDDDAVDLVRKKGPVREPPVATTTSGCGSADDVRPRRDRPQAPSPQIMDGCAAAAPSMHLRFCLAGSGAADHRIYV